MCLGVPMQVVEPQGEGAAWCVGFTEDGAVLRESYVNLIPTVAGGTHESGLKDGLYAAAPLLRAVRILGRWRGRLIAARHPEAQHRA